MPAEVTVLPTTKAKAEKTASIPKAKGLTKTRLPNGSKDNQYWKVNPRSTYTDPKVLMKACEGYVAWCETHPLKEQRLVHYKGKHTVVTLDKMRAMTVSGLCLYLGISGATWDQYKVRPDMERVCKDVRKIIYNQKFTGASADLLNQAIISREIGLADKTEYTGKNGGPIEYAKMSDEELNKRIEEHSNKE